ncbi:MAG: Uma2 family endonuclease [Phycisphaerales bacterium]|nr:Uma2 family endonuclease [Hyphomonadaceae bacterium]
MDGTVAQLPHRRFTGKDVERMVEAGLIDPDERIELIHGEIIDMGREGEAHWHTRQRLISWLLRRLSPDIELAPDGPLRLADEEEPEPDFYLFPASMNVNAVRGGDVILAVEIADSSLAKDRQVKAPLYADFGVREYWIVGLEQRETLIFRLANGAYAEPQRVPFDSPLTVPGVSEPLVIKDAL